MHKFNISLARVILVRVALPGGGADGMGVYGIGLNGVDLLPGVLALPAPSLLPPPAPLRFVDEGEVNTLLGPRRVHLATKERKLLQYLAQAPGKAATLGTLTRLPLAARTENPEKVIRTLISRLRAKLEPDPGAPVYLLTEWGLDHGTLGGYRLNVE